MRGQLKLMCVLAHPDDESLGNGGVLAKYAAEQRLKHVAEAYQKELWDRALPPLLPESTGHWRTILWMAGLASSHSLTQQQRSHFIKGVTPIVTRQTTGINLITLDVPRWAGVEAEFKQWFHNNIVA